MKIDPIAQTQARPKKPSLTFGDFVAGVCQACGERKGKGIVHLAVALQLIEFRGKKRIVIF